MAFDRQKLRQRQLLVVLATLFRDEQCDGLGVQTPVVALYCLVQRGVVHQPALLKGLPTAFLGVLDGLDDPHQRDIGTRRGGGGGLRLLRLAVATGLTGLTTTNAGIIDQSSIDQFGRRVVGICEGFRCFSRSSGHQIDTARHGRLVLAILGSVVAVTVVELLAKEVVSLLGAGLDLQLAQLRLTRAIVGHLVHALLVRIVLAVPALEALLEESFEQLLAQLTHRGYAVRVHHECVRNTKHHQSIPAA